MNHFCFVVFFAISNKYHWNHSHMISYKAKNWIQCASSDKVLKKEEKKKHSIRISAKTSFVYSPFIRLLHPIHWLYYCIQKEKKRSVMFNYLFFPLKLTLLNIGLNFILHYDYTICSSKKMAFVRFSFL